MEVIEGGRCLMSEVPLYPFHSRAGILDFSGSDGFLSLCENDPHSLHEKTFTSHDPWSEERESSPFTPLHERRAGTKKGIIKLVTKGIIKLTCL